MSGQDINEDPFRYDIWIEDALRSVVRRALEHTAREGFWGGHHFYITFRTDADGVDIPEHLRQSYPQEMTIVLQHEYWDLEVAEDAFGVVLSFSEVRTPLHIPFSAVTAFADPAVKFGLQLKVDAGPALVEDEDDDAFEAFAGDGPTAQGRTDKAGHDEADRTGEVIALDSYRKK